MVALTTAISKHGVNHYKHTRHWHLRLRTAEMF